MSGAYNQMSWVPNLVKHRFFLMHGFDSTWMDFISFVVSCFKAYIDCKNSHELKNINYMLDNVSMGFEFHAGNQVIACLR